MSYTPPTYEELTEWLKNLSDPATRAKFEEYRAYMLTTDPLASAAAALGSKGGQAKTDAKRKASAANGAKGGRPKAQPKP